jgi:hypothetical protein
MAKRTKKKRNKQYRGKDASPDATGPVVHHYRAEYRGPVKEWFHEKKRTIKIVSIIAAVTTFLLWVIVSAIQLIF